MGKKEGGVSDFWSCYIILFKISSFQQKAMTGKNTQGCMTLTQEKNQSVELDH
jgi:hypothetical protein